MTDEPINIDWPEIFPTVQVPMNNQKLKWTFECGVEGCTWITYHLGEEGAVRERQRHRNMTCPYFNPQKAEYMKDTLPPMEAMWARLDEITAYLIENRSVQKAAGSPEEAEYYSKRGEATGLAYAVWLVTSERFKEESDVAMWAAQRYKMNAGKVPYRQTPGCRTPEQVERGEKIKRGEFVPPLLPTAPAPAKKTAPKKKVKGEITPANLSALKEMHGKFPKETIMGLLKIDADQYDKLVAEHGLTTG
jgi:hypothetical protein